MKSRPTVIIMLTALLSSLVILACASSELFFMKVDSDATQTAEARQTVEQGLIDLENTLDARQKSIEAQQATQRAEAKKARSQKTLSAQQTIDASPPQILSVDFPGTVPGDHSYVVCKVKFHDPSADVQMMHFYPSKGVYKTFSVDLTGEPASTYTGGTFEIGLWCEGQQDVTLNVYLTDRGGHDSNIESFSFTCK